MCQKHSLIIRKKHYNKGGRGVNFSQVLSIIYLQSPESRYKVGVKLYQNSNWDVWSTAGSSGKKRNSVCHNKNLVYEAECQQCSAEPVSLNGEVILKRPTYVGETSEWIMLSGDLLNTVLFVRQVWTGEIRKEKERGWFKTICTMYL